MRSGRVLFFCSDARWCRWRTTAAWAAASAAPSSAVSGKGSTKHEAPLAAISSQWRRWRASCAPTGFVAAITKPLMSGAKSVNSLLFCCCCFCCCCGCCEEAEYGEGTAPETKRSSSGWCLIPPFGFCLPTPPPPMAPLLTSLANGRKLRRASAGGSNCRSPIVALRTVLTPFSAVPPLFFVCLSAASRRTNGSDAGGSSAKTSAGIVGTFATPAAEATGECGEVGLAPLMAAPPTDFSTLSLPRSTAHRSASPMYCFNRFPTRRRSDRRWWPEDVADDGADDWLAVV